MDYVWGAVIMGGSVSLLFGEVRFGLCGEVRWDSSDVTFTGVPPYTSYPAAPLPRVSSGTGHIRINAPCSHPPTRRYQVQAFLSPDVEIRR
jgi:hypothetical protein